jgi:DNA polymerase-3 subunit delta
MKEYQSILRDIQQKRFKPLYFLSGEEEYYIDKIEKDIIENALTPEEVEFNLTLLYGKEVKIEEILEEAKRFPMMSQYQVVSVREAQHIANFDGLEKYLDYPQKSTILIFLYKGKTLDKRKKIVKRIKEKGVLFESKKLYDNQVAGWIENYVNENGYQIDPYATQLLADYLGTSLTKITNELNKLFLVLKKNERITPELIEKNIGISKEFNFFEFSKSLAEKNAKMAFLMADYFGKNEKKYPLQANLSVLHNYFSKVLLIHFLKDKSKQNVAKAIGINPFFAHEYIKAAKNYPPRRIMKIIEMLSDYDLKSKGVNSEKISQGELLKELVYKILA